MRAMLSDDDEYLIGIIPRTVHYHHNPGGEVVDSKRGRDRGR